MLRMCRPIFGSGKSVVLKSGFFVAKGITELKAKGVYESTLIKKRSYWPKLFRGDHIGTRFKYKLVDDIGMIEAITEDNKLIKLFRMK